MGEMNRTRWVYRLVLILLLIGIPALVRADLGEILPKFSPSVSIQEEYNDNLDLTDKNKKNDFITTVYPGIRFSSKETKYGLDLDYRLGLVFYAKETDRNYVGHAGNLNAWYTWDRRLTFRARDYLIRSEEPREQEFTPGALPDQYLLGTQRARAIYLRNVFEPSIEYQLGKEGNLSLNYRNNIYKNQDPLSQDSREDFVNPRLTYWFNVRNGISLEYGLTLGQFDRSPDLTGHMATGRYTYRFNPRTSIFGDVAFLRRDFESPSIDYDVYRPSLGISHAFTPTLTSRAQLGYFWQVPSKGSTTGGFYYDASLSSGQRGRPIRSYSRVDTMKTILPLRILDSRNTTGSSGQSVIS